METVYFQVPPFKVAVNSNRGLYTDFGMGDILAEQGRKAYEQVMNENKEGVNNASLHRF